MKKFFIFLKEKKDYMLKKALRMIISGTPASRAPPVSCATHVACATNVFPNAVDRSFFSAVAH